ncbi:MAG TPA: (Fe-S)-binding protein [Oculatellaceae cyanobacterium]
MGEQVEQQSARSLIDPGLLSACIHCGLCLPACPTYLASGRETESPRGRIYLLSQWASGQLPFDDDLYEHIDTCLGCLGCQTACPSGVKYEQIINQARPKLAEKRAGAQRWIMRFVFAYVLPNYLLLRMQGVFLRFWQALKIDQLLASVAAQAEKKVEQSGEAAPHLIPQKKSLFLAFAQWHQFLPPVPPFRKLPRIASSCASGAAGAQKNIAAKSAAVQLFSGCMMDIFYNHVNHDTMKLLVAQNRTVENPEQTCCGALAFHAGESDIALNLAKKNIALFEKTTGQIAVTAAGCGAMLKEYGHLLKDDPQWVERAKRFSERVVDITEALADGRFTPKTQDFGANAKQKPLKVAYHAACHLAHAQSVRNAPKSLLTLLSELPGVTSGGTAVDRSAAVLAAGDASSRLDGTTVPLTQPVTLVPLKDAEHCCGSAGIYNLLHPEMALKVLDMKMDNIEATGADFVVTTNPGCLLQLATGVKRRRLSIEVEHLCEFLARYYT